MARTRYIKYYLHRDGGLSIEPPREEPPSTYSFVPRNTIPTIGGNISSAFGVMMPRSFDQTERPDVIGCNRSYRARRLRA